jgi:hypothetical protein
VPQQVGTPLTNTPDEHLLARFLLGYRDRTRAAYLADLRDFHAWCARAGIGLMVYTEATSRSIFAN